MAQTITAADIMAGRLPKTCREFNVPEIGKIKLFRLPAELSIKAKKLSSLPEHTKKQLEEYEQLILEAVYFMLKGVRADDKSKYQDLLNVMDEGQLSSIFGTGLKYQQPNHQEDVEKN